MNLPSSLPFIQTPGAEHHTQFTAPVTGHSARLALDPPIPHFWSPILSSHRQPFNVCHMHP